MSVVKKRRNSFSSEQVQSDSTDIGKLYMINSHQANHTEFQGTHGQRTWDLYSYYCKLYIFISEFIRRYNNKIFSLNLEENFLRTQALEVVLNFTVSPITWSRIFTLR